MSLAPHDGLLLVASRELLDPNFFRTVVLICRHSKEGSIGLILNRNTGMPVGKALSNLSVAGGRTEPLWLGGPVDGHNLWILHRRSDLPLPGPEIQKGVFFTADASVVKGVLRTNGPDPSGSVFRLFVGYAGWNAGQLEREILEGAWSVVPAGPACLFSEDPAGLWKEMTIRSLLPLGSGSRFMERVPLN